MKRSDNRFTLLAFLMAAEIRREFGRAKKYGGTLPFDAVYEAICMRRGVKGNPDLKREIGIRIHEQIKRQRGYPRKKIPSRISQKEIDSFVADYDEEEMRQKTHPSLRR